jgi:hypothetical protein
MKILLMDTKQDKVAGTEFFWLKIGTSDALLR